MGSREFIVGVVSGGLVAVALGCGPTTGPLGESMDTGTTTSEATTSDGDANDTGGSDGTEPGTTDAADESEGSANDGAGSSTGPLVGDVEMYGACAEGDCAPGLTCAIVSFEPAIAICTAQCSDPALDCEPPPDGRPATCGAFTHTPPDPFCAIECDADTPCPDGMHCALESPPFSAPFYCVPDELE